MKPFRSSFWPTYFIIAAAAVFSQINADYDDDDCGCPHRSYGEEYDSGEIKRWVHSHSCESEHCIFQVEPGSNSSLMLSLESITLNSYDSLKLSQYFVINETEVVSLHYVDLSSSYRRSIFFAGVGVGFEIEYKFQQRRWYGSSSFTLSFERVGPDIKTCPFPLLRSSVDFTNVPDIERLGPIRCPFRILPSVSGRKILLKFHDIRGTIFYEKQENGYLRAIPSEVVKLHSTSDYIDFVLESLSPHHLPRYNITFKELTEDPCHCDKSDVFVGSKPVYITSPGFPEIYCSNFRCKRRFVHNDTLRHDSELTFVVTVHFLSTEKFDYIQFSSDGISMERLNGTHEDVRLVFTGDIMETEFVTDEAIVRHGYNMSVESIQIPTECLCPHKGVKTMPTKGDVRMDIPDYCLVVYCKWTIPSITRDMKFAALFNFTSEADMLTVTTGNDIRQLFSISGKLARRQWEISKSSQPVTILYERNVQANSSLPSAMTSFLVSWMPSEGCSCDNGSIKTAVVGEWDVLTSPAYPLSYCNDMLCVTRIVAPEGHHVVLNITDFYTEPYNDVLALFDGWNITGRHIEVFHGKKRFPYLIRNSNETLSLVFKSDHEVYYQGFRLLFSAEPNEDVHSEAHSSVHFSTIIIILLSIMLVATVIFAVFRRVPVRFENPLYVASVSYSDRAESRNGSDIFS
uniref:CUB domain-containing protein n=1 Tax=Haemonchus contortus TaxID=6289 RepID=A0A7I4Y9E0_HAECO